VPDLGPNKLSDPERAQWTGRLQRDGPHVMTSLFPTVIQAVNFLREKGRGSEEIAAMLIMGENYDADHLTIGGPVVRHQHMVLLNAMERQAVELVGAPTQM
jgi:hypothetical protein